jgi:hypothetical protein
MPGEFWFSTGERPASARIVTDGLVFAATAPPLAQTCETKMLVVFFGRVARHWSLGLPSGKRRSKKGDQVIEKKAK